MLIEHGSVALAYAERGVSRRRVVQGVAWSVPAVLIATAAPAAAASASPAPVGTITVAGDGQRGTEGAPANGLVYRINNTTLTYSGAGYVESLTVTVQFPKSSIATPLLYHEGAIYGWQSPVVTESTDVVTVAFTKDPSVSFQHYIPNFGGGFWIRAATGAPAFSATVYAIGTASGGGSITGGGALVFT